MALGGSSSSGVPPSPPFYPIDIGATEQAALNADIFGYNLSDADFAKRFPGLVQSRDADIKRAYDQLTGPLDPTIQNQFVTKGLGQSLTAFGGGSEMTGVGKGTIGRKTIGASVARDTLDYQDQNRNYFENLLAANPQRGLGLSGQDAANLSIANTTSLSAANQQASAASAANIAASDAADAQRNQALVGAGSAIASAAIIAASSSGY